MVFGKRESERERERSEENVIVPAKTKIVTSITNVTSGCWLVAGGLCTAVLDIVGMAGKLTECRGQVQLSGRLKFMT